MILFKIHEDILLFLTNQARVCVQPSLDVRKADKMYTLHRRNTENSKPIFQEKELRHLSPNFHIHVSVSDLYEYSLDGSAHSAARKYVDRSCGNI
jgi:hypothetical protein